MQPPAVHLIYEASKHEMTNVYNPGVILVAAIHTRTRNKVFDFKTLFSIPLVLFSFFAYA